MARRGIWRLILALMLALPGGAWVSHVTAQTVAAACDGGWTYEAALPHAKAVLVGRIAAIRTENMGIVSASAIRVERANGIRIGSTYRGRILAGLCSDDFPRVGAHVVVLLGVGFQPGDRGIDVFYTIGRTVTASQAAQIGRLPDTATAAVSVAPPPPAAPVGVLAVVTIVAFAAAPFSLAFGRDIDFTRRVVASVPQAGSAATPSRRTGFGTRQRVPL